MVEGNAWQAGHVWQGGMCDRRVVHGRGHAWQGVMHGMGHTCQGDMHGRGPRWQEKRPLQQAVRILLECILV